MTAIQIVLVEPIYEGNIGFSARVMKNFGFCDLVLVGGCEVGDEAKARAAHAQDVLSNARRMAIGEVFSGSTLTVATTGEVNKSVCRSMRMPFFSPKELREKIAGLSGNVAVLFGQENWGLRNEIVQQCDMVCSIPTSREYPILNLSHAIGIVCYELAAIPPGTYQMATREEMEYLYRHISQFLDRIEHPPFKRAHTMLMMRRILGRSRLTAREATTVHGLLRRAEHRMDEKK
jgi:tRNA/rRNA methyltransferase